MGILGFTGCASMGGAAGGPTAAAAGAPSSADVGGTTLVAIAPPATPQGSIWDFLGIPQMMAIHQPDHQFKTDLLNSVFSDLLSAFPPLEPPPSPVPLTDPSNMGEDAPPANQAAASVKAQEDAANQKIKALNYLATIGCQKGYPEVEEAFLAALDDPTEKVRYTAVRALRDVAGSPCEACKTGGSCCTPAILKKLHSLAYDTDENGCPIEPSADVRREARLAATRCGGYIPEESQEHIEGPVPAPGVVQADSDLQVANPVSIGWDSQSTSNKSKAAHQIPIPLAPVPDPEFNPITAGSE